MKKSKIGKNYLKLGIIIIGVALLTILTCNLYKNYDGNKANTSYISKYVSSIKYNDLKSAIVEFSSDTFLYVSYTGDKNIYNFEKDIKPVIKTREIENNFIYVDVTNLMKNDGYLIKLNELLTLKNNTIKKLPAIVYFKDNIATDYIDSYNHFLSKADFEQLLDKYEVSE